MFPRTFVHLLGSVFDTLYMEKDTRNIWRKMLEKENIYFVQEEYIFWIDLGAKCADKWVIFISYLSQWWQDILVLL